MKQKIPFKGLYKGIKGYLAYSYQRVCGFTGGGGAYVYRLKYTPNERHFALQRFKNNIQIWIKMDIYFII